MTTLAKNSCAFCPTPAHHTSVLHLLVHKMQLEALWGNRAFFLQCNYKGNRGRSRENSEELQRSPCICGELRRAYSALWKLEENASAGNVPASTFRIVLFYGWCCPLVFIGIKWFQFTQNWCSQSETVQQICANIGSIRRYLEIICGSYLESTWT